MLEFHELVSSRGLMDRFPLPLNLETVVFLRISFLLPAVIPSGVALL
jgi:hypothetical protein